MSQSTKTIVLVGGIDPGYPHVQTLRKGLAKSGVRVLEILADPTSSTLVKSLHLLRGLRRLGSPAADALLLLPFCHAQAPVTYAWARARGLKVLFAGTLSLFHNAVYARRQCSRWSPRALRFRLFDLFAFRQADVVLTDSRAHADLLAALLHLDRRRLTPVYFGFDEETWFERPMADGGGRLVVHFNASFLPTHGAEHVLEAARWLRDRPEVTFEIFGDGQTFGACQALQRKWQLTNVRFFGRVPIEELPFHIARAHICLGIFGTDEKASVLVPLKVFQCLAMGKALITGDYPALREVFEPGRDLLTVDPGDGRALAKAILDLGGNVGLRRHLAATGHRRVQAFTSGEIGRAVRTLL